VALLLGGGLALSAHGTKATARAAINLSPEPVSNIVVSLTEDVVAFGTILLSVFLPVVTIIFLVAFLAMSIYIAPRMIRVMKGAISRVRSVFGYS
jgi:Fe2+ transport system protein B